MTTELARNRGPDFSDGVAFVTGGASGMGRATAKAFAAEGAAVMIADLHPEIMHLVVKDIEAAGGRAVAVVCDVSDEASVMNAVSACVQRYGSLNYAVNCAGIGGTSTARPFAEFATEDYDRIIAVNLRGVFLCMREQLKVMTKQGSGAIVNISSGAGLVGIPSSAAYTAAKHGVIGLTKTGALDHADQGIRVNAICPALTRTAMVQDHIHGEYLEDILGAIPLHRIADPTELADAALWLCSARSTFVTGVALPVDGGYVAR
jgi:NAD(P)-dependent dehydrogenase (short-subunit alcohol dehydrogenase family)